MSNRIVEKIKKIAYNPTFWIFLCILAGAIFVRTYHFNDWLYFKMDQSRDAFLVSNSVEYGMGDLPLLGPRVGAIHLEHGLLRLGPIFYYFQYLAGVLFQSTEAYVFAYPELFFSILALPLFYYFARLYFSSRHALMIVALYSYSFLIVEYSRFSWNPNSLQFFALFTFFGLLKFLNAETEKWQRLWLAVWALGLAIGSQLHFFGFFGLIGTSGFMIAYHYEIWTIKFWNEIYNKNILRKLIISLGVVFLVFGIFYTPVIISDAVNNGENSRNFLEALSAKPSNQPLTDKIVKDVKESLHYYCLLTTSRCYNGSLTKDWPATISIFVLFFGSGIFLLWRSVRMAQSRKEKDFLMLLTLWIGVFFILSVPVAYQLRPRFYILVFAIPFLLSGLIFRFLEMRYSRVGLILSFVIMALIFLSNLKGIGEWFIEQALSQTQSVVINRSLILKAKDGVTLGQLKGVADYMYTKHKAGNTLYYYVKPEHINPIRYMFFLKKDPSLVYAPLKINTDPHAEYFAVIPSSSGIEKVVKKFGDIFSILSSKQYGQLTVYELVVHNRSVSLDFHSSLPKGKSDRLFWKDVLDGKAATTPIQNLDYGE